MTRKRPWRDSQPNENSKRVAFDRLTAALDVGAWLDEAISSCHACRQLPRAVTLNWDELVRDTGRKRMTEMPSI